MIEALILLIVLLVVVIWIYSLLIKNRNQVLAAWSDIDVQLKRRHDLIPQLVTTVKVWAEQFTEIFAKLEAKTGQN
jgi:LemA protein